MSKLNLNGVEFNLSNAVSREKYWNLKAKSVLLGRKIVAVRYTTVEEQQEAMLDSRGIMIMLDNGTILTPMRDDEGNDAGALHFLEKEKDWDCLPTM